MPDTERDLSFLDATLDESSFVFAQCLGRNKPRPRMRHRSRSLGEQSIKMGGEAL